MLFFTKRNQPYGGSSVRVRFWFYLPLLRTTYELLSTVNKNFMHWSHFWTFLLSLRIFSLWPLTDVYFRQLLKYIYILLSNFTTTVKFRQHDFCEKIAITLTCFRLNKIYKVDYVAKGNRIHGCSSLHLIWLVFSIKICKRLDLYLLITLINLLKY